MTETKSLGDMDKVLTSAKARLMKQPGMSYSPKLKTVPVLNSSKASSLAKIVLRNLSFQGSTKLF